MSQPNNRLRNPGQLSTSTIFLAVGLVAVLVVVGALWLAVHVGHGLAASDATVPANPFELLVALATNQVSWPTQATWILAVIVAVIVVVAVMIVVAVTRRRRRRTRIDPAAAFLGRGRDIEPVTRRSAQATAQRLGVDGPPGVPIGTTLGGQKLVGSWEDMHIDVWGPRTGKTTSRAIPALLEAPGPVLATSNKRDLLDGTRDWRAIQAGPVWVFDPQQIANEPATWWWDPLTYVTDEVKAANLAQHFASGSRQPGARSDAFFDPAGQDLLAGLLLAGALDHRPVTEVYTWLTRPTDETPADILRDHGQNLLADQVAGVISAPDKQRGGIYGTAQQMASCLTSQQVAQWITPGRGPRRPHFDPAGFLAENGTLYSLSREGRGTAGPLVTALTVAVVEAAEELAARSAAGRLTVPLLGVLDEAANVCRWRDLPDLYSHFGSRGIVLMTILQSWSQGVEVWGEAGMKKLWSAANIKVFGGGVSEAAFLEDLSKMIGDYERQSTSVSAGHAGRGVSTHIQRERILDVADLAAIPKGRAVVFASGARPTLIKTDPWMNGPHAQAVQASILTRAAVVEFGFGGVVTCGFVGVVCSGTY